MCLSFLLHPLLNLRRRANIWDGLRPSPDINSAGVHPQVAACNATLDALPHLEPQQWHGRVHRQDYVAADVPPWGMNLQNIIEAGESFEQLIDHPSWLEHCKAFIGAGDLFIDEAFVTVRTAPGTGSPLHSGAVHEPPAWPPKSPKSNAPESPKSNAPKSLLGLQINTAAWVLCVSGCAGCCDNNRGSVVPRSQHKRSQRTQFRYHDGQFRCGEINILIALDDVGPGAAAAL